MSDLRQQRWYDRDKRTSVAVQLMMAFPDEFKTIICNGVSMLAEREFKVNEMICQFKSLGSDRVLAMFKSKERKRDYDKHPAMHQTMNYLYVLSAEQKVFMVNHIISLVEVVQDYLRVCQRAHQPPETEAVDSLTKTYVHSGPDRARRMLAQFEQRFFSTLQSRADDITIDNLQRGERIQSEEDDMRIQER